MLIFIPNFKRSFKRIPPLKLKSMPLNLAHTHIFVAKKHSAVWLIFTLKLCIAGIQSSLSQESLGIMNTPSSKAPTVIFNFSKDSMIVLNVLSKSSITISRSTYFWNSSLILWLSSNAFRISSSWKYFFVNHCYWICIRTHLHSLHTFTKLCIKIGKQGEIYFT